MTDIRISNLTNDPNARMRTEITLTVQVPLNIEDIRTLIHQIDEDASGEGEGIHPAEVSGIDFITSYLLGDYMGTAMITVDEMTPLPEEVIPHD